MNVVVLLIVWFIGLAALIFNYSVMHFITADAFATISYNWMICFFIVYVISNKK